MNRSPGKIYGPAGLVIVSSVFIVMLLVGGVAIGFTRNRTYKLSERIGELDKRNRELDETFRFYSDRKAKAIDVLELRSLMRGRLDAPTKEQVVTLRRRSAYRATTTSKISEDPRSTALDIAFIRTTPDRNTAVR